MNQSKTQSRLNYKSKSSKKSKSSGKPKTGSRQPKSSQPRSKAKTKSQLGKASDRGIRSASKTVRLNKYIADHGITSRRKADALIDEGKVTINGRKVFELGIRVDPEQDSVKVNGKLLRSLPRGEYYVFNKPKKVITSTSDPEGRPTVIDYFRKIKVRLFPVGRLDWDSEGLLLLTNDGDFADQVANPKSKVLKTYHAKLDGVPAGEKLEKLVKGVSIIGGKVSAHKIRLIREAKNGKSSWVEITIQEGKNRQIRKMFQKIGFDVLKLKRVSIGQLKLAGLKSGEYRKMTADDFDRLFR